VSGMYARMKRVVALVGIEKKEKAYGTTSASGEEEGLRVVRR